MLGLLARNNRLDKIETVFSEIHKSLNQDGYLVFSENLFSNRMISFFKRKINS